MGWGSGAELMDDIIAGLKKAGFSPVMRGRIYKVLIPAMQAHDWDTEMDCLDADPVYEATLRGLHPDWFEDAE